VQSDLEHGLYHGLNKLKLFFTTLRQQSGNAFCGVRFCLENNVIYGNIQLSAKGDQDGSAGDGPFVFNLCYVCGRNVNGFCKFFLCQIFGYPGRLEPIAQLMIWTFHVVSPLLKSNW